MPTISQLPKVTQLIDQDLFLVTENGVSKVVTWGYIKQNIIGYNGSVGFRGSAGYTGSRGGGFVGSVGYFGSIGYAGSRGYAGSQGAGFTGSSGAFAAVGFTGSSNNVDLSVVNQSIIPTQTDVYDIGSLTKTWRYGYFSVIRALSVTDLSGNPIVGFTGSGTQGAGAGYWGSSGFVGSKGFAGSSGLGFVGSIGYSGSAGTGLTIKGSVATSASLPASGAQNGDAYVASDTGNLWTYTGAVGGGAVNGFINVGQFVGYVGSRAYTGSTGFSGSFGYTGSASQGFAGSRGDKGDPGGYTGSSGFSTALGYTGSQGYTGSGFTGSFGYTGSQSYSGSSGFVGSRGFTGSQAYTGSQGAGFTGSIGFVGSASTAPGYTGSQGNGYTGSPGSSSNIDLSNVTTNIVPSTTNQDIGSALKNWKTGYFNTVRVSILTDASGNPITGYAGSPGTNTVGYTGSPGTGGGGGATISRISTNVSVGSLATSTAGTASVTLGKSYILLNINVSAAVWVRIYSSGAARTADAARSQYTDPTPGSGVVAEFITTGATTIYFTPAVVGQNTEGVNTAYFSVTNVGSTTVTPTITVTSLTLEA